MGRKIEADFVLKKTKRKVLGFWVGFVFFLIVETYFIINYYAYVNATEQEGIYAFFASLLQLFSVKSFDVIYDFLLLKNIGKILLICLPVNFLVCLIMWMSKKKGKKFEGSEYGSAKWTEIEHRKDLEDRGNSIPLAANVYLDLKNKKIDHLNEIVIGDTGAGKSFRKIIPDIFQQIGSYIITDTKGALYRQTAKLFTEQGYQIKVLNLLDLKYSNTFNPFVYVKSATDIEKLVSTFIYNTRTDGAEVGDAFWEDTLRFLLISISHYIVNDDKEEKTFTRVLDLIRGLQIVNGSITPTAEYERIIADLKNKDMFDSAVVNYDLFKQAPPETLQSILISCSARLRLWTNIDVRTLTGSDEMEIDSLAGGKTAIFLIIPDTDNTYKVIMSMFISIALSRLCYLADTVYRGPLPNLVSFELDEFANIGQLPQFDKMIATIRSRNIRTMVILQNLQQLEKLYDKAYKTILSNSHLVYLGTTDIDTNEIIVKRLGKTTIEESNLSRNTGGHGGGSESDRGLGRELLTVDELTNAMPKEKCIVFLKYYYPIFADKFKTETHKYFKLLGNDNLDAPNSANNVSVEISFEALAKKHAMDYEIYKEKHMVKNILINVPEDDNAQLPVQAREITEEDFETAIYEVYSEDGIENNALTNVPEGVRDNLKKMNMWGSKK